MDYAIMLLYPPVFKEENTNNQEINDIIVVYDL